MIVMTYRCTNIFSRYNHQSVLDYDSADKEDMLQYMRENGHDRPIDVWYYNLLAILNLPFEDDDEWYKKVLPGIYPADARWVQIYMHTMFPVICAARAREEEFILTEHAFCVHEGPISIYTEYPTLQTRQFASFEFHAICVISPRLALVFRSHFLPERGDQDNTMMQANKKEGLSKFMTIHGDPDKFRSLLYDLLVSRPLIINPSSDSGPDLAPTFRFRIYKFRNNRVQAINFVILEQTHDLSEIVFRTTAALKHALEYYLSQLASQGFERVKRVSSHEADPLLLYLEKLERIAWELGSKAKAQCLVHQLKIHWTYLTTVKKALETLETRGDDNLMDRVQFLALLVLRLQRKIDVASVKMRNTHGMSGDIGDFPRRVSTDLRVLAMSDTRSSVEALADTPRWLWERV
jgi:hypothetical protein